MENLKKMTIAEAKERIENEFCSLMTKKAVLRLLDSLENCCDDGVELTKAKPIIEEIKNANFENCVEFTVLSNQSVHTIIQGVVLPNSQSYEIILFNSQNPHQRVFALNNGAPSRTGNPRAYFSRVGGDGPARYIQIQREMIDNGINEITVRVCTV